MIEKFHNEKGFPATFSHNNPIFTLEYSKHALQNLNRYYYTNIPKRRVLNSEFAKLIEIEMMSRRIVTKLVYRMRYSEGSDITYVIVPRYDRPAFVKTVWINHWHDTHDSLNLDKYASVESDDSGREREATEAITAEETIAEAC